jgi:hypothetical protein
MKTLAAIAAVAIALGVPGTGAAGDDDDDENESVTRVACVGGTAELRLEAESDGDNDRDEARGEIEIELRVDVRRPVSRWRLVLLHERRIVYQGARFSMRDGYALRYWHEVPDWHGRQIVAARLATPSGHTCRLEAAI